MPEPENPAPEATAQGSPAPAAPRPLCAGTILALALLALLALVLGRRGAEPPTPAAANTASDYVLIDNRTAEEFAAGHLPGAHNLPYDDIAQTIAAVAPDKNAAIKLYCRSGRRSGIAKETLGKMGYVKVENLGGMPDAAKALGLAIVK